MDDFGGKVPKDVDATYQFLWRNRAIATLLGVMILTIGVLMLRGPGPPPQKLDFPYGPVPEESRSKREHGTTVTGYQIDTSKWDGGWGDFGADGVETAIHVGEGWDHVMGWDAPGGGYGYLEYDGSITFIDDGGSTVNTLRGLAIDSLGHSGN